MPPPAAARWLAGFLLASAVAPAATFQQTSTATLRTFYDLPMPALATETIPLADGAVRTVVSGSRHAETTRSGGVSAGSGTLSTTADVVYASYATEKLVEDASGLSFERNFEYDAAFDYSRTATASGNFFFITGPKLEVELTYQRAITHLLDGPAAFFLRLEATGARSGAGFGSPMSLGGSDPGVPGIFNFLILYDEHRDPLEPILTASLSDLLMAGGTAYSAGGSAKGVNYQIDTRMTGGALEMELFLEPAGGPVDVELNYFLQNKGSVGFSSAAVGTRTMHGDLAGKVTETMDFRVIPEPGSAALVVAGMAGCCLSRRRREK